MTDAHDRAVQKVAADYEARGYSVRREVALPLEADSDRRFQADLVAERDGQHEVVEVTVGNARGETQARRWSELAKYIQGRPGWHFKVVLAEREPDRIPAVEVIARELTNANELFRAGKSSAAILLASSAFEGAARMRLAEIGAMPQSGTSSALIERLVAEGELPQSEFNKLRAAMEVRNAVAHGGLDTLVDEDTIAAFLDGTQRLLTAA